MISKNRTKAKPVNKTDSKRWSVKVKRAGDLAGKALKHYGEPTISLAELRKELNQQLQGTSLSNAVLKDREAAW
jgi:hypothetical protein